MNSFTDELSALQELHSWHLVQFNATEVKLSHAGEICVVMRLTSQGIDRIEMSLSDDEKAAGPHKLLRAFFFDRIKSVVEANDSTVIRPAVVRVSRIYRGVSLTWLAFRPYCGASLHPGLLHSTC